MSIKHVWCYDCASKKPPTINKAEFLIPFRKYHYGLDDDGLTIDLRLIGICSNCLKHRNKFQQSNTQDVDVDNPNLIKRSI